MQLISLLKPTSCAFVRLLPRVQPHSIAARARVAAMSTAAAAGMPPSPPPKSPAEIAAERAGEWVGLPPPPRLSLADPRACPPAGMTLEEAFAIDQVEGGLFKKLGPEPIVKLAHEVSGGSRSGARTPFITGLAHRLVPCLHAASGCTVSSCAVAPCLLLLRTLIHVALLTSYPRHLFNRPPVLQFYDRVYADDAPWFKAVFASSPKEVAIRNQ